MKTKKTIIILAVIFVATMVLSGCGTKRKATQQTQQKQQTVSPQQQEKEPAVDEIEFSDPGDDEMGKEIREIDELINETSPSEYNEDDLSEEAFDAELQ